MELSNIYQPIQKDLTKVEDMIHSLCKADLDWLNDDMADGLRKGGRVDELLAHILSAGGKRLRPSLVLLSASFYDNNLEHIIPMAAAIEILHIATLVHDDAIDNSALRHGRPTVNSLWGDNTAILMGDYLLAKAGELAVSTGSRQVVKRLYQTLMTITSGELSQAFSAFHIGKSRAYYMQRISSKTASLISLATECGAILSHAPAKAVGALKDYGFNIGIAFQIIDDILDYTGTTEEMGKPVGSDLNEGTITLPVLLLLEKNPHEMAVIDIIRNQNRKENTEKVKEIIRNSPDIILKCYQMAADYREMACERLMTLPDTPSRDALVELACFIVERRR
ncbi:MAG: polyprenyl synthetase family protein [Chloroflexota bacterium]